MSLNTFEGIVESGQIRLPENVRLPERARVYVIVPALVEPSPLARVLSPRLAHPGQAKDFAKILIQDAGVSALVHSASTT